MFFCQRFLDTGILRSRFAWESFLPADSKRFSKVKLTKNNFFSDFLLSFYFLGVDFTLDKNKKKLILKPYSVMQPLI